MPHRIVAFNHSSNILLLIESILKKKGFEVFTFLETLTDTAQVVELAPDLVIIGHVRGFADEELKIIDEFRSDPTTAHVPIVICTTGAAQLRQSDNLEDVPYVSIVPKPFDVRELLEAVHRALGLQPETPSNTSRNTTLSDSPTIP